MNKPDQHRKFYETRFPKKGELPEISVMEVLTSSGKYLSFKDGEWYDKGSDVSAPDWWLFPIEILETEIAENDFIDLIEYPKGLSRANIENSGKQCFALAQKMVVSAVRDYEEVLADKRRLTKDIDVIINGEDWAAEQPSLCDLVSQIRDLVHVREAKGVLLEAVINLQKRLEMLINATPSGYERDIMTEENILVLSLIEKIK